MDFINLPILIFGILLSFSILTSLVSFRMGVPIIFMFLCVGLLGGDGGLNLNLMSNAEDAFFIGSVALALILFDSGFHTPVQNYKNVLVPSAWLATVGVILTAVILAPFAKWILMIGWIPALLLASVISSTDSASVFFLLRKQGIALREKIKATLEVESGANDPMAIFLTLGFITLMQQMGAGHQSQWLPLLGVFLKQLFIGVALGGSIGWLMIMAVNRIHLDQALYPILVLAVALTGFAGTNMLGGSGFLAMYLAGLILGNAKIQAYVQISKFQQTLTWLSQILMFITLGLFVSFKGLEEVWIPALLISIALMFIVRPLMVFGILAFFPQYSTREKWFISFVGMRGATSILLAIAPIVFVLPDAQMFFNIIFVMVLMSLGFQGFLLGPVARLLNMCVPVLEKPAEKSQIDLPGLVDTELVMYELSAESPAVLGKYIPRWARPLMVMRDGILYDNIRTYKAGDKVYVLASSDTRQSLLDKLFGGGLHADNLELLGDFPLAPETKLGEVVKMYGVEMNPTLQDKTVAELLTREGTDLEVGDRLSLGAIELVVRSVEKGIPTGIGVDIDPSRHRKLYTRTWWIPLG